MEDNAGGIGAGGSDKRKGKNIVRQEAEDRKKKQQEIVEEAFKLDFGDGSTILKNWIDTHLHLLKEIVEQTTDICWALVIAKIVEFLYNKDRNHFTELDVNAFVRQVKLSQQEIESNKKLESSGLAVNNLRKAMDHVREYGLEKAFGKKTGNSIFTVKGNFVKPSTMTFDNISTLLDNCPLGMTLDVTPELVELKEGIYRVPKPQPGKPRHAVMIVGLGTTKDGEMFLIVQNTWGLEWGVNGRGRIMIGEASNDVFYLEELLDKKKKK